MCPTPIIVADSPDRRYFSLQDGKKINIKQLIVEFL